MIICLRPTTKDDLEFVLTAEQDKENRHFIRQWTREQHEAALEDSNIVHLIVERITDRTPVGYVILVDIENPNQSLAIQRIVVTDKGKGYGREALRLIKKLAFEKLQAHRLWLDVKDYNLRARHVYETEGFVFEGVLRECLKGEDGFESLIVMSILRTEYDGV